MSYNSNLMNMISQKDPGDKIAKKDILNAYLKTVTVPVWMFIAARTLILPLKRFHERLPGTGRIVEIGCGHGIICQYLARRCHQRTLIGFDPDRKRIEGARKAAKSIRNIEYRNELFENNICINLTGVVVVGVFNLVDDDSVKNILQVCRKALIPGGVMLISDVPYYFGHDPIHRFHLAREKFLGFTGFTIAQGLFLRSEKKWISMIQNSGFPSITPFNANVFMHRTFDWICK